MVFRNAGEELIIGETLLDLSNELSVYREFINNYNEAARFLELCLADEDTKKKVEEERQGIKMKTPALWSQLITPIQRVPRYCLLIQDLLDHMPQTNDDYPNVSAALRVILQTGDFLEKEKASAETMTKLHSLQEKLTDLDYKLVVQDREYLKEGDIIKETPQKKSKYCHLFLFNDTLLVTHQKGSKYVVKHWMWLSHLRPELLNGPSTTPSSPTSPDRNKGLEKTYLQISYLDTNLLLYSMTSSEITEWYEELTLAVTKNHERWDQVSPRGYSNAVVKSIESSNVSQLTPSSSSSAYSNTLTSSSSFSLHSDDSSLMTEYSENFSCAALHSSASAEVVSHNHMDDTSHMTTHYGNDDRTDEDDRNRDKTMDVPKRQIFVFTEDNSLMRKLSLTHKRLTLLINVHTTFASIRSSIHQHLMSTFPLPIIPLFQKEEEKLRIHARKPNGKWLHFHEREYAWQILCCDPNIRFVYK
eukprot:TRINITY_DN1699_c0_g1_i2.p1 TRINITY_DN1699_c0_g1~~TRINITY_DN1699_c0_g1_i2.p1  ORF type:complete len:473 (-),score=120.28 TRINITY_DN1699_c0_g1_i2:72-1490(-)